MKCENEVKDARELGKAGMWNGGGCGGGQSKRERP